MSRPGTDLVLLVPIKVSCDVLGSWLPLKSIVRLSVACHRAASDELLRVFWRRKEFLFPGLCDLSDHRITSWLLRNEIKTSNIVFNYSPPFHIVAEYVRKFGQHFRSVDCQDGLDCETALLVASYCKGITFLSWSAVSLPPSFRDILIQCTKIRVLRLLQANSANQLFFNDLQLHNLQVLSVRNNSLYRDDFPWSSSTFSNSLTTVDFDHAFVRKSTYLAIARNCPQLRSLRVHAIPMAASQLIEIVTLLPGLGHLDVSSNGSLTDAGLLSVVKILPRLKSINIQDCSGLTDAALSVLAEHLGTSLEVVYVDIHTPDDPATEQHVSDFCQQCTKLSYLNINCLTGNLTSNSCAYSIVDYCLRLRTLVVNDMSVFGTTVVAMSKKLRPDLEVLEHSTSTEYNICDMPVT